MDERTFKKLFLEHRSKISEAWEKLSDKDLDLIAGDLNNFIKKVSEAYKIPNEVILKELDAVKKNIEEGIHADFASRLDPVE